MGFGGQEFGPKTICPKREISGETCEISGERFDVCSQCVVRSGCYLDFHANLL
jgi:hypothetical protein